MDYKDIYIKKIEEDKEKLYKLVEKGLEIDEKNNIENQKTIRMLITIFSIVILIICFLFSISTKNLKNSNLNDNKNLNYNINSSEWK